MTNENARSYFDGKKAAYLDVLRHINRECELDPTEQQVVNLTSERHGAIRQLRELCEMIGDNDWPDELNMADIIEKHILKHLDR